VSGGLRDAAERLLSSLALPVSPCSIGIKLNLCDYRRPETGAVTDPAVLGPVLAGLRRRYPASDIFVFEHDANSTIARNLFAYLGIDRVADEYGVRCVSLADEEWVSKPIPKGVWFKELEVPRILMECDFLINHPKLKTHGRTLMTCALKNMFGCIRPKKKVMFHQHLSEAIVDVNQAIPTHLTIVDANLCVEGNRGPTQGLPKRLGLLYGGSDVVAVDAFGADLMGFGSRRIQHIRLAAAVGLGSMRYQLCGDDLPRRRQDYKFKFSMANFALMQVARRVLA
jgi:uncharacterized protein (DUF362 family)